MVDPKLARAYGTLAGFGFIGVALLTLPSTRLLDPLPAPESYLLTLLALVTGLICIAVPWDWIDPRWLHLVGVAAIIEAAATVAVFGQAYVAFFFLIAVLVAYVAPDARTLGLQLGLICVALFAPALYGPEDARSSLHVALVVTPALLLTAGLFAYLRQKMVHDRLAYHRFAEQTLVLSSQIAGRPLGGSSRFPREAEPLLRVSGLRPPAAVIAGCAAILGLPLFTGGLAVAGVKLPELAQEPFESLGVELPNQDDEASAPARINERPEAKPAASSPAAPEDQAEGGAPDARAPRPNEDGGADPASPSDAGSDPVAPPAPAAEPAPAGPDRTAPQSAPPPDTGPIQSPLNDLLDQATQGLQGLLEQIQSDSR